MLQLESKHLYLISGQTDTLDAAADNDHPLLSSLLGGIDIPEKWSHFPEALAWMRDHLREFPQEAGWWFYFIIHKQDTRLIGTAGFKGYPEPDGSVEIGYEIHPDYQGKGLATEAAQALIDDVKNRPGVLKIRAHTLAEENPSTSVLKKLGLRFVQEKIDIEDGKIWEWEMPL
jgi:RimJ/RimL family protein N-acetyltransferase